MKRLLLKKALFIIFMWHLTTAQSQECFDGEVRDQLDNQNSPDEYAGEVHYCLNGTWATVCDTSSSWTNDEATVACRQLGYSDKSARTGSLVPCAGTDSFVSINCNGGGESLRSCDVSKITASGGTARVACQLGCNTNGEVRLVGGTTNREGRVEVCVNGRWGTICNSSQERIAGAVCSQLGFSRINAMRSTTDSDRLEQVYQCTVDDSAIECTITNSSQCDHSNDLTVSCLTHENATDYLLSQLNKTNNIVTEYTQELNKTNSTLQECTEQSKVLQSSTSVLQAFLAVAMLFLAGVIVGWIVTCILTNYLCNLCKKRHKSDNSSSKMTGGQERLREICVSKQCDTQDAHPYSPTHANLPDPHQEIPSNYPEMGTLTDAYATVDLELKKKDRQKKQKKQMSGSAHQREGESSHYPAETEFSEGPSLPVKPQKYTGPGMRHSNEGGRQGDVEFFTQDDSRVYAAVVKPKKNRKNNKY